MPTLHPDDWAPKRRPPRRDWRDDPDWYMAAFAIAIAIGLIVILVIDGKGLW